MLAFVYSKSLTAEILRQLFREDRLACLSTKFCLVELPLFNFQCHGLHFDQPSFPFTIEYKGCNGHRWDTIARSRSVMPSMT